MFSRIWMLFDRCELWEKCRGAVQLVPKNTGDRQPTPRRRQCPDTWSHSVSRIGSADQSKTTPTISWQLWQRDETDRLAFFAQILTAVGGNVWSPFQPTAVAMNPFIVGTVQRRSWHPVQRCCLSRCLSGRHEPTSLESTAHLHAKSVTTAGGRYIWTSTPFSVDGSRHHPEID